ncbi:MAG: DUF4179 domain-containing protein [Lachnospiraceae bacterium]
MHNPMDDVPVSDKLDQAIDKSIKTLHREQRNKILKRSVTTISITVLVFAAMITFCINNPVMATKLPLIGHLFARTEKTVSYKGDFSKKSQKLITNEDAEKLENEELTENQFVKTSGGITVTISESYSNKYALYLAVKIENEEEFPADFNRIKNQADYVLDYDRLELEVVPTTIEGIELNPYYIEGQYEDMHTFVGIIRIPLSGYRWWPSSEEIRAAGIEDLEVTEGEVTQESIQQEEEYNNRIKEAFPRAGEELSTPDSFTYEFTILSISSDLSEYVETQVTAAEGDVITINEPIVKSYEGTWDFTLEVVNDPSKEQVVTVNEINETGTGIGVVTKTPYEVTADIQSAPGTVATAKFLAICDAQGDLLDNQGSGTDVYSTYGRDTSTIYVFVCDEIEYLDELKGYYYGPDYEEKRKEKTFAQYLTEHALYSKEITFSEG